jgi:mono/diheme cytochrome c family protein
MNFRSAVRTSLTIFFALITPLLACGQSAQPRSASSSSNTPATTQHAFVNQYCVGCHNAKLKTAGVMLDKMNVSQVGDNAEVWEKVVRKLRAGMMPPSGLPRPDRQTIETFTAKLESDLDRAAAGKTNPGAPALHRLNRTEYANAIRDILSLEIDATSLLPVDDSSAGFDNNADALGVSPALMERYLAAASKISRMAVGDTSVTPAEKTYAVPNDLTQDSHIEGLPFGTRGGILIRHHFPVDGEYVISVELSRGGNGVFAGAAGTKGEELEVSLNGERVQVFNLSAPKVVAGKEEDEGLHAKVKVSAGTQSIAVTFIAKNYAPAEDTLQPYERSMFPGAVWTVVPHVGSVTIKGPSKVTGVGDTPSRRQIFVCRPATESKELPCAKEIISSLGRRAFRRPLTDADLEEVLSFYQKGRNKGSFDNGIEMALRRILASPEFMFRFEREAPRRGESYRISDLELASRLSFFLWSSVPDEELLKLATQAKLRDPHVLEQQVRRMLANPRSSELVNNFAGQWLYLRNLQSIVPALEEFPDFDDNLRQAFRRETELFFGSVVHEDRSVLDLLTADYSFINERLARHYGIPNIYGSEFRRVTLDAANPRRGLLGQGSILTATSLATRTSPVLRGKWILENILGVPPPEPPPNVPTLKEITRPTDAGLETVEAPSVRQRLEEHRANPVCASCHKMMDPIGFSLENFDAVGQWRTKDGRSPIDASGQLVDGTKIDGPAALRQALMVYSDQFVRTMTEKLLIYASGRGVAYYDMPVVRSIVRDAARNNYRFSSLILGVVRSPTFQMRMKSIADQSATTAAVRQGSENFGNKPL